MRLGEIVDGCTRQLNLSGDGEIRAKLVFCIENALALAAEEHCPLTAQEQTDGGEELDLQTLKFPPLEIVWVKKGGKRVPFERIEGRLWAKGGFDTVLYRFAQRDMSEETELLQPIPKHTAILGGAAEYLLCGARYEEGDMYMRRFLSSLAAFSKKRGGRLPHRRLL